MIWLLDDIAERIKAVNIEGVKGPTRKLRPGSRVIGTLPDDLKRLYILIGETGTKVERIKNETISPCEPTEDGPDHYTRARRSELEHRTLVSCFWTSLGQSLPAAHYVTPEINENWEVVTASPLPEDQMSERFFRMMEARESEK